MGHYDDCREGNCKICGQAIGYCSHTEGQVYPKLKSLEEADKENLALWKRYFTYPKPNGIACPECRAELFDTDCHMLPSNPPQRNIHCEKCGYRGHRLA